MTKFRAWLLDMMWFDDTLLQMGQKERNLMLTMNGEVRICDWRDGRVAMHSPAFFNLEAIVMQYTGLKDKNGKEIFSGDILKSDTVYFMESDDLKNHGAVVVWLDDCCCFGLRLGKDSLEFSQWLNGWQPGVFEIIGNEFENPELLQAGEGG